MRIGFGLISCQLSPGDSRTWTEIYREALGLTVACEELGFASVWTTEHHFVDDGYMPSVLPMSAAMAAMTDEIEIGTGVMLAPLHHPLRLAEDAATVDLISEGRLVLGLGLGWSEPEFEAFGADRSRRGRAMEEILSIVPAAWSGEPIDHRGSVYQIPPVVVRPTPARAIPIVIGGGAEAAVRRGGRLANGFFSNASPTKFKEQIAWAVDELGATGRSVEDFRWIYYTTVYPCDDPDRGWSEIRNHVWTMRWKYGDMERSAYRSSAALPSPPPLTEETEIKLRKAVWLVPEDELKDRLGALRTEVGVDFEFVARSYFPGLQYQAQLDLMAKVAAGFGLD